MKTSDEIARCDVCRAYAKSVSPNNWQELFNMAWLKTRERELRDANFKAVYYKTYFFASLISCKSDSQSHQKVRNKHESYLGFVPDIAVEIGEIEDVWKKEMEVLNDWIDRKPDNEFQMFLQNIVTLTLTCKNIKEAAKLTGMSKRTFFKYLREAKTDIDYEYFITTNSHPLNLSDVV